MEIDRSALGLRTELWNSFNKNEGRNKSRHFSFQQSLPKDLTRKNRASVNSRKSIWNDKTIVNPLYKVGVITKTIIIIVLVIIMLTTWIYQECLLILLRSMPKYRSYLFHLKFFITIKLWPMQQLSLCPLLSRWWLRPRFHLNKWPWLKVQKWARI